MFVSTLILNNFIAVQYGTVVFCITGAHFFYLKLFMIVVEGLASLLPLGCLICLKSKEPRK
jgi:hypothetical protein